MRETLLLALALTNAVLYCCALPLWEGFDEPFHYAYVESLVTARAFPVMNRSQISEEIRESFGAVPLSRLLSQAMPGSLSFEEWSRLSDSAKELRRGRLQLLPAEMRRRVGGVLNYEVQQAPLAYVLYAPFDLIFSGLQLSSRIMLLRLLSAVAATLATVAALNRLANALAISSVFRSAALFVVLNGQMLWASVAHVGNDFAAVPMTLWFLVLLTESAASSRPRSFLMLATVLAAGLLTKAYFLAFVPVFIALLAHSLVTRRISKQTALSAAALGFGITAPWYVRNYLLYGTLSGTQQSLAGIGVGQALAALPKINWLRSASQFAIWSLWTGNWSFLSFSQATLKLELLLLFASFLLYLWFLRRPGRAPQIWVLSACAVFGASLVYQTCVTWVHTGGASMFPEPWYAQGVLAVCVMFCFRGLAQSSFAGKGIAAGLVIVSSWIAFLTYVAKLLPYYGAAVTRSNLGTLWSWWRNHPSPDLRAALIVPVPLVYALLLLFVALLGIATVKVMWSLMIRDPRVQSSPEDRCSPGQELPPRHLP